METRLKHIFTQKVQSLTQSPAWRAPITPDGHLLSLCPSQSTWKKDHHLMDAITEPHILYLVSASDWNRKWLWRSILHPDEQKQRKLHSGKLRLERTEEQGCPQPRLTCLLVTWLQTAAPVVTLNALSSEQVSLSEPERLLLAVGALLGGAAQKLGGEHGGRQMGREPKWF